MVSRLREAVIFNDEPVPLKKLLHGSRVDFFSEVSDPLK
jgi:hypothetical protein